MQRKYGAATLWAFIAVFGYAAQHPFEKPFVAAFHGKLIGQCRDRLS